MYRVVSGIAGYVTVSAKISRKLKELMDKYNIKLGLIIRRAIEEEVRRRALSELEQELADLLRGVSDISDEEIAKLIREDRDER